MPNRMKHQLSSINQFRDFALYAESPEAINTYLTLAQKTSLHTAIRQLIVLSKHNIVESVNARSEKIFSKFESLNSKADVFQVSVPGTNESKQLKGVFSILPGNADNIHRITTVSQSDYWIRVVRKLAKKSYPDIMPIFFKQNEIRDALLKLEGSLGSNYQLKIVETTMKSRRENKISGTERYWEEVSIREIFDIASDRNLWFTSLKYVIQKRVGESKKFKNLTSGRLYKRGEIHVDWLFSEVSEQLVSTLENYAIERLSLLQNRGIRENNYHVGPPLEITYNEEVFSNLQEVRRFGEAISKYRDASKAVFHGNPYYHASIADFLDGSSFEVWILSPERVIIVPQAKSSSQALERLISHIYYEFREGNINEFAGD